MSSASASPSNPAGSWASSLGTRRSMEANGSRDTSPELAVRSAVHRLGLRYRVHAWPLPGLRRTADLIFRPSKVAVFIDGCFWHSCPEHGTSPRTNSQFWQAKLTRNVERDRETDRALTDTGWKVLRFWEHEDPESVAQTIKAAVSSQR